MPEARTIQELLGERLREHRLERGLRQDGVAAHARMYGLPWSRSMIAQVEAGRRELSLQEVVVLATIVSADLGALLGGGGRLLLAPGIEADADELLRGLSGAVQLSSVLKLRPDAPPAVKQAVRRVFEKAATGLREQGRAWPNVPIDTLSAAAAAAAGEAEQKAARKLRVKPIDVSLTSFRLWGRSLTAERDRRAQDERAEPTPQILGWVTRSLVREIDEQLRTQRIRRGRLA